MGIVHHLLNDDVLREWENRLSQTCCNITIIDVLLEIAYLTHYVEQQADGALELEHLTVQAEVIL